MTGGLSKECKEVSQSGKAENALFERMDADISIYLALPLHDKTENFSKNIKPGCIDGRLNRSSNKEGIIFFLTVFHSNIEIDFS